MSKTLIFSIVGFVLLIIIIFFIKRKKKEDNNSMEELIISEDKNNVETSKNKEPKIDVTAVNFKVFGNEDKYAISFKGNRIQFFVKDNEIVGFLDKDKSNRIYYYEKGKGENKNV